MNASLHASPQRPAVRLDNRRRRSTVQHEPLAGGAMVDHALADDAATLNPMHPINVSLRQRGVGLVPMVLERDDAARAARIASSALRGRLVVPYGWHVIDDGQRLRLLDPQGEMQICLSLVPTGGRSTSRLLDAIEAEMKAQQADPQCVRLSEGPLQALAACNVRVGDQVQEQYHLMVPGPDERTVLHARVITTPDCAFTAGNLGEDLLAHVQFRAVC